MGIALAREFLNSGKKVILVESGDEDADYDVQSLFEMEIDNEAFKNPPDSSRLRFLGGSTNHWGGWSQPVSRQVIDQWPVFCEEIERYHGKTIDVLGIQDRTFYRIEEWAQSEDQYFGSFGPGILSSVRQIRALRF